MSSPNARPSLGLTIYFGLVSLSAGCGKETPPSAVSTGNGDKDKTERVEDLTQSFVINAQYNGLFVMKATWREILANDFSKLLGDDVESALDRSKKFNAQLVSKWGINAPKLSQLDEKRASKVELFTVNCEQSAKQVSKKHLDGIISESAVVKKKILEANPRVLVKYEIFDRSTGVGERQDREQKILNPAKQAKLDADRDLAIATAYRKETDIIILTHMNQCKSEIKNAIAEHEKELRMK